MPDVTPEAVARPLLHVVRGAPDDIELAAMVAAVAALMSGPDIVDEVAPSTWSDRAPLLRRPLPHGPGAWRASALPR